MEYLKARLYELSTWRGLVLILTAAGMKIFPLMKDNIIIGGIALAGALGLFFRDSLTPAIPSIPASLGTELNVAVAALGKEAPKEETK